MPWRPALLEVAHYPGTITLGEVVLDNHVARAIAKTAKKEAVKQRKAIKREVSPVIDSGWVTEVITQRQLPPPPMRLGAI